MRVRPVVAGAAAIATLLALAVGVTPAQASAAAAPTAVGAAATSSAAAPQTQAATAPGHDRIVSEVPAQNPTVLDGAVWAFAEVGDQMVVGGNFNQVSSRGSDAVLSRPNIFIFDKATGQVSTTAVPQLNGKVETLLPGPTAGTFYAGGDFTTAQRRQRQPPRPHQRLDRPRRARVQGRGHQRHRQRPPARRATG